MTPFEVIILVLIYSFCYGYACKLLEIDDESRLDTAIRITGSVIIAFYVLLIIGAQIANKLNDISM